MSKVYFSQIDSRWKNHPYPANAAGYRNKTIGTSGCGVTCGAMIISSCKETIYPDAMGDLSRANGYRVAGGTADGFFPFIAKKWGIEYKRLSSSYEAYDYCNKGWFVVICCGAGLWTTGGHFILAVGTNAGNKEIQIYDPYLYSGKFNRSGRSGKVRLVGNSAYVQIDTFKANSNAQRFFAFNVGATNPTPAPTPSTGKTMYVNTKSDNLNVRKTPGGTVVGSLPKGTKVTVYETSGDWSRIGTNKWVSSSYLASTKPGSSSVKTMYVNTNSAPLNVRKTANGTIIGELKKGTEVKVTETSNGWSKITSPMTGWVSAQYLSSAKPSVIKNTVGQTKYLKSLTTLYSKSNLSGTRYTYKANTKVVIQLNVSSTVDKIRIPATGRVAYCKNNVYK